MNKILLTVAILALVIASCQKKVLLENSVADGVIFTAQTEEYSSGTKTSLDNGNILWKRGDEVSIFKGSTINEKYRVSDSSDGMTSTELQPVNSGGFVASGELATNVAYYPYGSGIHVGINENLYELSVSLPETQHYAENSFGNGAFPMMAVTEDTDDYKLKFKNVMGCLKLQLKGTAAIKSIVFRGNADEKLCGTAVVRASSTQKPVIAFADDAATEVTLDCSEGVQLNEESATAFLIALPPVTMNDGFTVVVADTENKTMEISSTKSQTITRSNILRMPEKEYIGESPDPEPEPTHEYVDLGLSVKWATCNLGADHPYDYGGYYAWGETKAYGEEDSSNTHNYDYNVSKGNPSYVKSYFDWATYKYATGTIAYRINKYTASDNKTTLEAEDDAATANWGGSWRMPTGTEWEELLDNCTWTWCAAGNSEFGGVAGYKVQSKKDGYTDKYIFLPAAGFRQGSLYNAGSDGYYWSSSLYTDDSFYARYCPFDRSNHRMSNGAPRHLGNSVRPVYVDESVDLGLSVKWATCNLGAEHPYDYGGYYAWGETKAYGEEDSSNTHNYDYNVSKGNTSYVKSYFSGSTYKYATGTDRSTINKYTASDNKTTLEAEDDAATANWGGSWRMPTGTEWEELQSNCTWTWCAAGNSEFGGVAGYKVQSKKDGYTDKYIFLPAAGYRSGGSLYGAGSNGYYWSSSLYTDDSFYARYCNFRSSNRSMDYDGRSLGGSVRPVLDK